MKKIGLFLIGLLAFAMILGGCGNSNSSAPASSKNTVLKVGATAVPHAEILNFVKPLLAKEGVDLQVVEFSDYVQPNLALSSKELDANFFQHIPYLEKFSTEHNLPLTYTVRVHLEPMGVYSKKVKNLSELADGAQVAIPNDPTNGGRALAVLEKAGLLKLKEGTGVKATVGDIVDNPKKLVIRELEAPLLPRALDDVAIAVINTNYALTANLSPNKDALFIESKDSPYANILAIRQGDENRPEIQKLSKILNSAEVKQFINDKYQGAILPAF
ncbi:MAG: MetQ/NlpA family ABC transporter substrate-binding protein [Veillonellales bacterium]